MKLKDYKNLFNSFTKKLNEIDFNLILDNLKNFKIDDLKRINYKRVFYDVQNSQYLKPTLGIISASLVTIFFFVPAIDELNDSFKKAKRYKYESINLSNIKLELKNKNLKLEEIRSKMAEINSSFLKKEQIIFISKLLNETAKKTNVNINTFSPIFRADSSKLCKISSSQRKSKKFKSTKRKTTLQSKGLLTSNYFEATFSSDYLDIISFLKEIQLFDVTIIPLCLEVDSQQKLSASISKTGKDSDSIIIPLNKEGEPLISYQEVSNINNDPDSGNVQTKIIFKIPSYKK